MDITQLTYSATPNLSFAGKTIKITIDARNNTANPIVMPKGSSIKITFPGSLVSSLSLQASTPPSSGYYVEKGSDPGEFIVKPNPFGGKIEILPEVSWKVSFESVPLTKETGTYNISILEKIIVPSSKGEIQFTIEKEQQKVIAWLDPKYIGDQEVSKLYWQAPSGISALTISGYPNKSDVPVKNPSLDGNVEVYMLPGTSEYQRSYSVNVQAGGDLLKSGVQVLQKNDPIISAFIATSVPASKEEISKELSEISINESIYLNWITDYASAVILTTPTVPNKLVAKKDQKVQLSPGLSIQRSYYGFLDQLPETADFYLTANGSNRPSPQKISLKIRPIKLLYYRYKTSEKQNVEYETDPPDYSGIEVEVSGKKALTLYQIGGKVEVYYPTDPK